MLLAVVPFRPIGIAGNNRMYANVFHSHQPPTLCCLIPWHKSIVNATDENGVLAQVSDY